MTKLISFFFICITTLWIPISFAQPISMLILGDSLSAGYQMKIEQSWPSLLSKQLQLKEKNVTVINASVSGDTTGNALDRVDGLLKLHTPDWVLIELGANDGLRGFNVNVIKQNLAILINKIQQIGANVALMQIQIPPNYGKRYSHAFASLYPQIAKQFNLPLLPFFLEGIIIKPEWMMKDGLHPKPDAQPWIAEFMAQQLAPLLTTKN